MIRFAVALLAQSFPALAEQSPLPFNLGGAFELTDQTGTTRTEADPQGNPQLLYFGYANCRQICSAALPMMAQVIDTVSAQGITVTPVMITVDPARDTVETLGAALSRHHENFVGLTGTPEQLQVAFDAFQLAPEEVFVDPDFGPIFAHGSFLYLLDAQGELLTLVPPVITPDAAAKIVIKYTQGQS